MEGKGNERARKIDLIIQSDSYRKIESSLNVSFLSGFLIGLGGFLILTGRIVPSIAAFLLSFWSFFFSKKRGLGTLFDKE